MLACLYAVGQLCSRMGENGTEKSGKKKKQ